MSLRENLASDMYLISQMDSDQYVPIVTVANLDHVKKLSTDVELIVDILRCESKVRVADFVFSQIRQNSDYSYLPDLISQNALLKCIQQSLTCLSLIYTHT